MSGKTLDYGSVGNWMSLAVWAAEAYTHWDPHPFQPPSDEEYTTFFHKIAEEALNRAFSLRSGDRAWAVVKLLQAIAPHDEHMRAAFHRINKELWLTPPGARPTRKGKS